jgi:endoglucanase
MQRLRVAENRLSVRLRGVNLSGLEYSRGAISPALLDEVAGWGSNFVRIPFNQRWLLDDPSYLDELDTVAREANSRGLYVLFDLHWLDYGQLRGGTPNIATPPLPDESSPRAWELMARRFAAHPAVMFDLLNEPHDRLPDDAFPLHAADGSRLESPRVGPAEWLPWARRLAAAVRAHAPDSLIFVSGTDWGRDLHPLVDLDHIVYSAHLYPRHRGDWRLAQVPGPVVAAEIGPPAGDLAVMEELLDFLDERDLGWAAWSVRDQPALKAGGQLTEWGKLVVRRLGRA